MNRTKTARRFGQQLIYWVGAAAMLAAFSGTALAASITNTKHNLSSSGTGNKFSGTDQICVFCHTPHGSDTTAGAPIWNKKLTATGYTTYDTSNSATLDGELNSIGPTSLACLSCHDGTQAMNSMINAPGSGGYNAAGADMAGSWSLGAATMGGSITAGALTGVVSLSKDLSNDHPIGIQYCGGGIAAAGTGTCNDSEFVTPTHATIGGKNALWVDTGGPGARAKTDLPLYVRTFTSGGSGPSVECGSCHDPHVEQLAGGDANAVAFMRVTTSGSQICLSCHVK